MELLKALPQAHAQMMTQIMRMNMKMMQMISTTKRTTT